MHSPQTCFVTDFARIRNRQIAVACLNAGDRWIVTIPVEYVFVEHISDEGSNPQIDVCWYEVYQAKPNEWMVFCYRHL